MTCKEVIDFLGDYLDRALPWRQRLVFNLHLVLCRHCRRYLASYSETVRLARALGRDAIVRGSVRSSRTCASHSRHPTLRPGVPRLAANCKTTIWTARVALLPCW